MNDSGMSEMRGMDAVALIAEIAAIGTWMAISKAMAQPAKLK